MWFPRLKPDRNEVVAGGLLLAGVVLLWFLLPYIVR